MNGNSKKVRICMKRKLYLLVWIASFLLLTVSGCIKNTVKTDEGSKKKTPTTFNWYVNFSWYSSDWGNDLVSQKITEDTNVSVKFLHPSGNESEKLSALMNSDSLPDLITLGWWEPQVDEMIEKGMVYALNKLADEYDPVFWRATDRDAVEWFTRDDGNIYCYPNSFYTPKDLEQYQNISSNETFLVRKDIYEAIGSPDMSTPEGFSKAIKKAAQLYPEVDGKPLIPIGAHTFDSTGCVSFDKYLHNFLSIPYEVDGKIYDRYTDPEYIRWLKAFRQLETEGYLAPDIFIDTRTQMEEKILDGRYFCMLYQYTDILNLQKMLASEDPDKIYMAVDGPSNSRGDDPRLPVMGINGWTVTFISKSCKDPEKAIQFIDYLLSEEGQMVIYLGVEGETYDIKDGQPVVKEKVQSLLNTNREAYDKQYGADYKYWMFQNLVMQSKYPQKSPDYVSQLKEWGYPYAVYGGQYDVILSEHSEEAKAEERMIKLWGKVLPTLLLAESEEQFEERLAAYIAGREKLGYQKVQDKKTELMNEAKEKLRIK